MGDQTFFPDLDLECDVLNPSDISAVSSEEEARRGSERGPPPGLVDLPAEEHPVGGDAAGGQQLGAVVGRGGQLGNDRGARRGVGVHHAQEFPISEVKREKHED